MLKQYYDYFKERFPLPGVILYAGSLYWIAYSFAGLLSDASDISIKEIIPGLIIFILIFLHLRLFDEHKDYEKDCAAYPQRMLSRGIITLRQLKILMYPTIILEVILSIYLGLNQLFIWVIIFIWTVLMLKEFFLPEYLQKRIVLYLVSHQILVPLMMLFPVSQRINLLKRDLEEISALLVIFAGSMCLTVTFEMARKIWSHDRENEHADSYSREWGINKALGIVVLIAIIGNIIINCTYKYFHIESIYIIINGILYLFFVSAVVLFQKKSTKRNSTYLEISGALYMIGIFINSAIAFTLQSH